jgi:hypothetical protein
MGLSGIVSYFTRAPPRAQNGSSLINAAPQPGQTFAEGVFCGCGGSP